MMRQAIQALCVVTLDVPADIATADLPGVISDAIRTGSHATAEPVGCMVRSVREEAAIFNNNGDQWVVGPHGIYKSDAPQFHIGFAYSHGFGQPFPDRDAMPGRIAEALNLAAGAVPTIPADLFYTLGWALGMATEAISLRENSDDEEDTKPDMLAMHKAELAKGRAMLRALPKAAGQDFEHPALALLRRLWTDYGLDHEGDLIIPGRLSSPDLVAEVAAMLGEPYEAGGEAA